MTSDCNIECGCDTSVYQPVCMNGLQYISPCQAGCPTQPLHNNPYLSQVSRSGKLRSG